MLELYIGNMKADLTGQESILTQKTRTDYTNPTVVKNSFTKTVSLPGTKANSFIFNFLWKLDRVQTVEDFNPSRRVPFTLTENGNLIESGYIKLDKINKTYDTVSYDCTLFGELGNILYELSYKFDEETGDVTPLTLGDLDYNMKHTPSGNIDFEISLRLVRDGWDHLDKTDEDDSGYNTLNFAICNNGVPKADNFDPKKMMVSILGSDYTTRKAAINWDGTDYARDAFPTSKEVDGTLYSYIDTMLSRMDQSEQLALMEMDKGITCIEARDFRSYLQRPILRLKAVFEAIGRYLNKHLGWTLDITDDFFTGEEFLNSWITLSMLYEINPKVETGTYFTQKELLSNTSSPASYLVSYCKSYGIYIDPDIQAKTLRLIRLPHYFTGEEENLIVDQGQQMEITPLSFDKSAYTFDFAEGEGQFLKKYKDTYGVAYGTKRVNTGYRFDASVAPYITNNIFKTAADTIEQSAYFHYNYDGGVGNTKVANEYPIAVAALTKAPKYSLFRVDSKYHHPVFNDDGTVDRYEAEMTKNTTTKTPDDIWGYMYATNKWSGLQKGIYQDTLARLQFHDEKGEAKDGKNVLIRYNGKVRVHAGWCKSYDSTYDTTKSENTKFIDYTDTDGRGIVKYLISDDSYMVKSVLGTNCYYDIPSPAETPYNLFASRLDELPTFNRVKIDYGSFSYNPAERHDNWFGASITRVGSATTDYSGQEYVTVNYPDSSSYVYWNFANFERNHKYLIVSKMICSSSYYYLGFLNYETLYSRAIAGISGSYKKWTISAAVVSSSDNSFKDPGKIRPRQSGNNTMNIAWYTIIDLTNLGLTNLTAAEGIKFFKFDQYNNYGTPYFVTSTLDFGVSREIGIPATIILPNSDIYNRYWSRYIADVYSVDTRIIKGKVYLPNIQDSFRKFYYYDNATWILSSIQDWNNETKLCTGTFTKVNDKQNYLKD